MSGNIENILIFTVEIGAAEADYIYFVSSVWQDN